MQFKQFLLMVILLTVSLLYDMLFDTSDQGSAFLLLLLSYVIVACSI